MSISVTIISNVTVLVSNNVTCFEYFIPRAMVSIRRFFRSSTPPPTRPLPLTLKRFSSSFACCFTRNNLSTFLCSNQIIAKKKTMHFQCKTIFSFQHIAGRFCCFLYICFLGCFSQFCHHKTTNSFIFAKYMYSVLFCLSSNHVA